MDVSIPPAAISYLEGLRGHVAGLPALYATKFLRCDERANAEADAIARVAFDAALNTSFDVASGVPADGWLIATPRGIHLFRKSFTGGVGTEIGLLTGEVVSSIEAEHGKKASKSFVTIGMADGSSARLQIRTGETYPALGPWVRGASRHLIGSPADAAAALPVL